MDGKMKIAAMDGARNITFFEREIGTPGEDEVLVKMEYVGVCGSDLHFYQDGRLGNWVPKGKLVLGHESGGKVVEVGKNVKHLVPGDKVALEPGVPCGKCEFCRQGKYNLCVDMSFMAIPDEREGAFKEFCIHPANMCFKLPVNMSTCEGALIEPLAVGFHAANISGAKVGQNAVILGAGCIGLTMLMALKAYGVNEVYVFDIIDKRLEKAQKLGATGVFNAKEVDIVDKLMNLTNNNGVDMVYEAAGSEATILTAAKLVKKGGVVTLIGMAPKPELTFDIGTLTEREAEIKTVFRYRNLYPTAIKAVGDGLVNLKDIVSDEFKFDDLYNALEHCISNKDDIIKAVITF